jgi:YD repeat-containing protein
VGGSSVSTPLVSSRRLRDGTSIGFAYDHLGRLTDRDTPNAAFADFDSVYAYDNLGRPTSLAATTGTYVNLTYDALGRVTAQTIHPPAMAMAAPGVSVVGLRVPGDAAGRARAMPFRLP